MSARRALVSIAVSNSRATRRRDAPTSRKRPRPCRRPSSSCVPRSLFLFLSSRFDRRAAIAVVLSPKERSAFLLAKKEGEREGEGKKEQGANRTRVHTDERGRCVETPPRRCGCRETPFAARRLVCPRRGCFSFVFLSHLFSCVFPVCTRYMRIRLLHGTLLAAVGLGETHHDGQAITSTSVPGWPYRFPPWRAIRWRLCFFWYCIRRVGRHTYSYPCLTKRARRVPFQHRRGLVHTSHHSHNDPSDTARHARHRSENRNAQRVAHTASLPRSQCLSLAPRVRSPLSVHIYLYAGAFGKRRQQQ